MAISVGAALSYFLDPDRGRSRRHMARDRGLAALRHGERYLARRLRRGVALGRGLSSRALHSLTPAAGPPPDDVTLAHRVESVIFRNPAVPKGRFNVNAERGVVFLRGQVDRPEQIAAVERATRKVPGVRDVRNLLHLPDESAGRSARSAS